jgi:hypothetical protein
LKINLIIVLPRRNNTYDEEEDDNGENKDEYVVGDYGVLND